MTARTTRKPIAHPATGHIVPPWRADQSGIQEHQDNKQAAITIGDWPTEQASVAALDARLDAAGLWRVHREVEGTLVQPRPGQRDKLVRIDRVLVPNQDAIERGWTHGIVGIEAKRSGVKIGHALAQAIDYGRSVWTLPGGFSVWLDWVFVWPIGEQKGTVASIMAQNRIGYARPFGQTVRLAAGEKNIGLGTDGNSGTKVGSR